MEEQRRDEHDKEEFRGELDVVRRDLRERHDEAECDLDERQGHAGNDPLERGGGEHRGEQEDDELESFHVLQYEGRGRTVYSFY